MPAYWLWRPTCPLGTGSRCKHNKEPKGRAIRRVDGTVTKPVQVQVACPYCDKTLSSLTRIEDHFKIFKSG